MLVGFGVKDLDSLFFHKNNKVICYSNFFLLSETISILTLMLQVAHFANTKQMQKSWEMTETLAYGYSSESTQ